MEFRRFLPRTTHRVLEHTSDSVNRRIAAQTRANVEKYGLMGSEAIDRRVRELEREWDVERTLETAGSLNVMLGLMLGAFIHRRFFAWSGVVAGFLLMHALQGWCPPLPILRRLGFRTAAEIDEEINALRMIRGDLRPTTDVDEALSRAHLN
jgi:hypothetical protein